MSHPIDFYAIEEHARIIEQLCCSSENYLQRAHSIQQIYPDSMISEFEIEQISYNGWLEYSVSNNLISLCTKLRILQDSSNDEWDPSYSPEQEAFEKHENMLSIIDGRVNCSIRECCNKIIHALNFELTQKTTNNEIKYWDGCIIVSGTQNKKTWKIKIDLFLFCQAVKLYLNLLRT
ncbi:hypothetical protein GZA99_001579 [Salmonella enterica]|nr:hypothetical protein [Salmonella enterica]EGQ2544334.1 hypothetical protein [Salmonella enterica]